jgi:hypothetical protein
MSSKNEGKEEEKQDLVGWNSFEVVLQKLGHGHLFAYVLYFSVQTWFEINFKCQILSSHFGF